MSTYSGFAYIIANKTTYTNWWESRFILLMCVFEEMLYPSLLIVLTALCLPAFIRKKVSFLFVLLSFVALELFVFPETPMWWSLFFYQEAIQSFLWRSFHPGLFLLFPYIALAIVYYSPKKIKLVGILILFIPFFTITEFKKSSNEKLLTKAIIIPQVSPWKSPDQRPIISDNILKNLMKYKETRPLYLWNEAYFQQTNSQNTIDLREEFSKDLPGEHFFGLYNAAFMTAPNGFLLNEFLYYNSETKKSSSYRKHLLVPFDETFDRFKLLWAGVYSKKRVNLLPGESFKYFDYKNKRIAFFLCNEIAHLWDVSSFVNREKVDYVISPSNVPLLFDNHHEDYLKFYSRWLSVFIDKKVLRYSSVNSVQLFEKGSIKTFPTSHQAIYEFDITL